MTDVFHQEGHKEPRPFFIAEKDGMIDDVGRKLALKGRNFYNPRVSQKDLHKSVK